jgi:hypothetical protein
MLITAVIMHTDFVFVVLDLDAAQMALLQQQEMVVWGVLSVKAQLIVTHVMQQSMDVVQMV